MSQTKMRVLTPEDLRKKVEILEAARASYSARQDKVKEYKDDHEWRLARVNGPTEKHPEAFPLGLLVIARKDVGSYASDSIPKIRAYSTKARAEFLLFITDPIEFLED